MSWWREKGLENGNKLRWRENVDVCCLATPIEVSKIKLVLCEEYGNTFERKQLKIDFQYEISIDVISTTIRRQTAISMKFSFLLPQNTLMLC